MVKISELTEDTAPSLTDIMASVDLETNTTKKITIQELVDLIGGQVLRTGIITPYGGRSAPSGWLLCYGQAISRTDYADLFNAIAPSLGTFTVTIASPGVFTLAGHGLKEGDAVYLTTTGALPTGLSQNTLYYVISAGLATDTFRLATARGGSAINTSGSQSGVHTLRYCPYGLGNGSSTFNVPDLRGRSPQGADAMGGTAASRISASGAGSGLYGQALGSAAGAETHTLTEAETPSVQHKIGGTAGRRAYSPDFNNGTSAGGGAAVWGADTISNHGSGGAHNNMPPSVITSFIIKT